MIEKIAVLGAGQMGSGIAHVAALAGYQVELIDISASQLKKAATSIENNLERQLKKNFITVTEREKATTKIVYGDKIREPNVQLVIEAVSENITLKQQVLRSITASINADCILATNTSSISLG